MGYLLFSLVRFSFAICGRLGFTFVYICLSRGLKIPAGRVIVMRDDDE